MWTCAIGKIFMYILSPLGEECFALSLQFPMPLKLCGFNRFQYISLFAMLVSQIVTSASGILAPFSWLPLNWNCTQMQESSCSVILTLKLSTYESANCSDLVALLVRADACAESNATLCLDIQSTILSVAPRCLRLVSL